MFAPDGRMERRVMSGNEVLLGEGGRWFAEGGDVREEGDWEGVGEGDGGGRREGVYGGV